MLKDRKLNKIWYPNCSVCIFSAHLFSHTIAPSTNQSPLWTGSTFPQYSTDATQSSPQILSVIIIWTNREVWMLTFTEQHLLNARYLINNCSSNLSLWWRALYEMHSTRLFTNLSAGWNSFIHSGDQLNISVWINCPMSLFFLLRNIFFLLGIIPQINIPVFRIFS